MLKSPKTMRADGKFRTYIGAFLATGFLVWSKCDFLGTIERRTLHPRACDFQCSRIASAHGTRIVTVRWQIWMP